MSHKDVGRRRFLAPIAWIAALLAGIASRPDSGAWAAEVPTAAKSETAGPPTSEPITAGLIESRRKEAEQSKDLEDATRAKILELYGQASAALKKAADYAGSDAESKTRAASAAEIAERAKAELKRLKQSADESVEPKKEPPAASRPLAAIEKDVAQIRALLDPLLKDQAGLEREAARRSSRRKEIRALLLSAPDRIGEVKKQLASAPPRGESPLLIVARNTLLAARLQCLDQEVPALKSELARYDAEDALDLVRLERDRVTQQIRAHYRRMRVLTDELNLARRLEAERAVDEARRKQIAAHPLLRPFAEANTRLAEETQSLTKPIEKAGNELKQARITLSRLTKQFEQTKEKADSVGLTGPIGQLLRKQRGALPDPREHQRGVASHTQTIDEAQFRMYEIDELRTATAARQPILQAIEAQSAGQLTREERQLLVKATHEILDAKQEYLDALARNYNNYCDTLLELVSIQQKLIDEIDRYADYIDERVLWIRSSRPLAPSDLLNDGRSVALLGSPDNWRTVARALLSDARTNPLSPVAGGLLFGLVWYFGRRFRAGRGLAANEARASFTDFAPTMRAFLLTFLGSSAVPAILGFIGWRLRATAYDETFPAAVSDGLLTIACLYWPLNFVVQSCRPGGLAEVHFGWSACAIRSMRRHARWLALLGLPPAFFSTVLQSANSDPSHNAVERCLFAGGMGLVALFLQQVLRPATGILHEVVPCTPGGWGERLRGVWRWATVLAALAIAALVIAGYDYTAHHLVWRLYLTTVVLLVAYYVRAAFSRWILIRRRRLGLQELQERRATETRKVEAADASVAASILSELIPKFDLAALSAQTRALFNACVLTLLLVGCWRIWLDVFPSMNVLNDWVVYGMVVGDDDQRVTVANVLVAALVVLLTWVSMRNIPGLLEMTVLRRLPLDNAARFAISTVARYAIVMVGLILASSTVGIGWAKVQWLATALTFGLAFGLQEIFANFIAGLIILFERPVRVGDMVTIDNVTGVVTRVRIRATTITTGERKEFIVPNKEFITGRLLNWTLTDTVNRIEVNVEIAHGSDTELAREILLKTANSHAAVLKDPSPSAAFEAFSEHGLKLVLRCFLPNLAERTRVIHELHTTINRALAASGIELSAQHHEADRPSLPRVVSTHGEISAAPDPRQDATHVETKREAA